MGSGIALAALYAGLPVVLFDVSAQVLEHGMAYLRHHLQRKGKLKSLDDLESTADLSALAACDLIIEAVPEDLELKRQVFSDLQAVCSAECILATNTSTLSVTAIAAALDQPGRAVGMHFFNPAAVLPLVEVVRAAQSSEATVERAVQLARGLGKSPVVVADSPGFIVNRLARPFYGEALKLLGEGAGDIQTLDWILQSGAGFPMGPFRLMDLIGLDVNLAATTSMYEQSFGEQRYRPHAIQQRMVLEGRLGRKVGAGFYDYSQPDLAEPPKSSQGHPSPKSLYVSDGSWAPGLVELVRSAGALAESPGSAEAGLVAASVSEGLGEILTAVDRALDPSCPLFCQTADVTLHEASLWVDHPDRLVGFDGLFLASGKVATLTRGPKTSQPAAEKGASVMYGLGRWPLWVDDPPGMVSPRVVAMLVNEAAFALGEGVAPDVTLDEAMTLGVSYPQGPLSWGRALGLDRVLAVLEHLQREFGEDRYRAAPWLRRQVRADGL